MKKACVIKLSEAERLLLLEIVKGRTSQKNHIQRAQMILACAQDLSNEIVGRELNENPQTVGKWRRRWHEAKTGFEAIQAGRDKSMTLSQKVRLTLSDAPRSGGPPKFTMEQLCQIYAVATERPEESNIPLSHWSLDSLAKELVKRKIVKSISTSQLNVFLKSERVKTA